MKIALICDKPFLFRHLLPFICERYPQLDRDSFVLAYANEFGQLNSSFQFPRGIKYSAYPCIKEPEFKPLNETLVYRWHTPEIVKLSDGNDPRKIGSTHINITSLLQHLKESDVVILAHDPCPSGDYVRLRVRQWLQEHDIDKTVINVRLVSYDCKSTMRPVLAAQYESAEISYGRARESILKRYFDYNYLVNAIAVHGETARFALGHPFEEMISKNALQILYFLREHHGMSEGQLIRTMETWRGTGRYTRRDLVCRYRGLGSEASRAQIIEHLVSHNLLNRIEKKKIAISEEGKLFLKALHPDSEDPDQIFRVHQWSQLSVEEGKAKIDRYLRTFFGKQKRYLTNLKKGL